MTSQISASTEAAGFEDLDFSDLDLSDLDVNAVEIVQADDTMGMPSYAASCRNVIWSCSCSISSSQVPEG